MPKALAGAGAIVGGNYSGHPEGAQKVVNEIRSAGEEAAAFRADAANESQVQAMFQDSIKTFGTVNILVNNAGI